MSPGETLVMCLLSGALAVAAGLWAIGQVAGRLFGGAWPDVHFGDMADVLFAFPKHLSDPQLAWPTPARTLLPGPVGFYAIALLLVMVLGTWLSLRSSSGARPGRRHARVSTPLDGRPGGIWRASSSGALRRGG